MSKIVKMSKNRASILTRMKSTYIDTGIRGTSSSTILVPDRRALFFDRIGRDFDVRNSLDPVDVFTENFTIYPIPAEDLVEDVNYDKAVINQNESSVEKVTSNSYLIEADLTDMQKYTSTNPAQALLGEFYWLGLIIATGSDSIIGKKFNGYTFTQDDVTEANSVNAPAGSFILWLKLENGNRTFVLENDSAETAITLTVKNTAIEDVVAPYMVSAIANFEAGNSVAFIGRTVTAEQNSVLTTAIVTMSNEVVLNDSPKATILIGENEVDYATITVDEVDAKKVIITPIGSNGIAALLGDFTISVPEDAVRHRGVGNVATSVTLTVVEAIKPAPVSLFANFDGQEPIEIVDNAISTTIGEELLSVEATLNTFVELNGTPKVYITIGEEESVYGSLAVDAEDATKVIFTPDGENGHATIAGVFAVRVPADSIRHLGVGNDEIIITLTVTEA